MTSTTLCRFIARLLTYCPIALICLHLVVQPAHAQVVDTEPPVVGFDTVDEARKGDSQVFTVTATDNQSIQSLAIFYRFGPDSEYQSASMSRIGETDLFSFTIRADAIPDSVDVIEYYLEAKDDSGNRTLQGFSFDPVERALAENTAISDGSARAEKTEPLATSGSLSTSRKIVYGVLGVVVVGALIAAAGSSDDNASPSGPTTELTIVVPPLDVAQ